LQCPDSAATGYPEFPVVLANLFLPMDGTGDGSAQPPP
jgi:hypothetical protein